MSIATFLVVVDAAAAVDMCPSFFCGSALWRRRRPPPREGMGSTATKHQPRLLKLDLKLRGKAKADDGAT